uniref:Uncharacterized protein n=1 Tax=Physcomitrium patens TaxID=3218 RepID=A0A2K1IEK1_PHYPA|nr:hypothetical protein PHYPA_029859 [Physcomitrium patens]
MRDHKLSVITLTIIYKLCLRKSYNKLHLFNFNWWLFQCRNYIDRPKEFHVELFEIATNAL